MSKTINPEIENLKQLRLPELRARYVEVLGKTSKSPNKTFLARSIVEALANQTAEPEPPQDAPKGPQIGDKSLKDHAADQEAEVTTEAPSANETPLTKLTVPELQAKYLEIVGRPTGSSNRNYMIWKVKQAIKGRIPIGPRRRTAREPGSIKVLPLRMDADLVNRLDEARERLDLPSRMELFRRALHTYLDQQGEADVATLFAPEA